VEKLLLCVEGLCAFIDYERILKTELISLNHTQYGKHKLNK